MSKPSSPPPAAPMWKGKPDPWDKLTIDGVSPECRAMVRRWNAADEERHGRTPCAPLTTKEQKSHEQ